MAEAPARRRMPVSGAVATMRTVSSSGRSSTVYGRPAAERYDADVDIDLDFPRGRRLAAPADRPRPTPGRPARTGGPRPDRSDRSDRPGGPGGPGGGRRRTATPPPQPSPTRRRRDPLWARLLVMVGALLMMVSGGLIVSGKAIVAKLTGSVREAPLLGGAGVAPEKAGKVLDGALNILMVGIDERPTGTDLVRADSILILHIPASHDQAYLFSIPRDALVDIPAFRKTGFGGSREKINGAFAHGWDHGGGREGGFELLALTVQRLTGLRYFNAGAIVDFNGFQAVVDALGGVDMCVDTKKPVVSEHIGFDRKGKYLHPREGGKPQVYLPGECRRFNGGDALDYVRQRKSLEDGDYGRARHQQQFLKAMAKEAKKQGFRSNPLKIYDVVKAAGKALTVDLRGESFENWVYTMRSVADNDLVMLKANGGKFNSVPCGNESCEGLTPETIELFNAMRNDTVGKFVVDHPDFVNT